MVEYCVVQMVDGRILCCADGRYLRVLPGLQKRWGGLGGRHGRQSTQEQGKQIFDTQTFLFFQFSCFNRGFVCNSVLMCK